MRYAACCIAFGLSIGTSTFSGAAGSVEPGQNLVFVPYRPTLYGVHAGFGRRLRIEIGARYGEPGLAIRGDPDLEPAEGFLVVAQNVYKLVELSGSVSIPLVRLRGGPTLRGVAGLSAERWSSSEFQTRNLIGALAGFRLDIGLTRMLDARVDAGLGVSPSPFRSEELPEGFAPRTALRRTLAVGLSWRL